MSYYLETDEYEGGIISRQLTCQLRFPSVKRETNEESHTQLYYLAVFYN